MEVSSQRRGWGDGKFVQILDKLFVQMRNGYKSSNNWTISNVPGFQHFAQNRPDLLDRQLLAADVLGLVV